MLRAFSLLGLFWLLVGGLTGCAFVPEISRQPQFHNPFPQLHKIAVMPFFNQSADPTINGSEFANLYRTELQQIRGFEVLPVGVVERYLRGNQIVIDASTDFQQLARELNVDALVVGSITDFDSYYPPRMGLAVHWYAANPCFHPIPAGYGLPWGTADEEFIPEDLVFEAEFELAQRQLDTQTPYPLVEEASPPIPVDDHDEGADAGKPGVPGLPADWPDPRGFIPEAPQAQRPDCEPHDGPVMELIRQYDGADRDFTTKLANYYYFRDDARIGGWQSYLDRKADFARFCCYLHITELLTARGGGDKARLVFRWPFDRYED